MLLSSSSYSSGLEKSSEKFRISNLGVDSSINLPENYWDVKQKLIYFSDDNLKIYYGGPIDGESGVQWVMPATFEDEGGITSVYELAFINCGPFDAHDAKIQFIDASDIDIKLKNQNNEKYNEFKKLMEGKDGERRVIIRFADTTMVAFPDVFISDIYCNVKFEDQTRIVEFLSTLGVDSQPEYANYDSYNGQVSFERDDVNGITVFADKQVEVDVVGQRKRYFVKKVTLDDQWRVYYLVSLRPLSIDSLSNKIPLIRTDSGCVSGQIYDDDSCDCLDQFHHALNELAMAHAADEGFVLHMPTHDGRGFGTAPKAETEIYKRGGQGMIKKTPALDTVTAAKLLYQVDDQRYDIRTFESNVRILKWLGITEVQLLTDNVRKVQSLEDNGIKVHRKKTGTNKSSCLQHLEAKKNDSLYFSE